MPGPDRGASAELAPPFVARVEKTAMNCIVSRGVRPHLLAGLALVLATPLGHAAPPATRALAPAAVADPSATRMTPNALVRRQTLMNPPPRFSGNASFPHTAFDSSQTFP